MEIYIKIPNGDQADLVLNMLKAIPDTVVEITDNRAHKSAKKDSRTSKPSDYYGALSSKMSIEDIDKVLEEQRGEWT